MVLPGLSRRVATPDPFSLESMQASEALTLSLANAAHASMQPLKVWRVEVSRKEAFAPDRLSHVSMVDEGTQIRRAQPCSG